MPRQVFPGAPGGSPGDTAYKVQTVLGRQMKPGGYPFMRPQPNPSQQLQQGLPYYSRPPMSTTPQSLQQVPQLQASAGAGQAFASVPPEGVPSGMFGVFNRAARSGQPLGVVHPNAAPPAPVSSSPSGVTGLNPIPKPPLGPGGTLRASPMDYYHAPSPQERMGQIESARRAETGGGSSSPPVGTPAWREWWKSAGPAAHDGMLSVFGQPPEYSNKSPRVWPQLGQYLGITGSPQQGYFPTPPLEQVTAGTPRANRQTPPATPLAPREGIAAAGPSAPMVPPPPQPMSDAPDAPDAPVANPLDTPVLNSRPSSLYSTRLQQMPTGSQPGFGQSAVNGPASAKSPSNMPFGADAIPNPQGLPPRPAGFAQPPLVGPRAAGAGQPGAAYFNDNTAQGAVNRNPVARGIVSLPDVGGMSAGELSPGDYQGLRRSQVLDQSQQALHDRNMGVYASMGQPTPQAPQRAPIGYSPLQNYPTQVTPQPSVQQRYDQTMTDARVNTQSRVGDMMLPGGSITPTPGAGALTGAYTARSGRQLALSPSASGGIAINGGKKLSDYMKQTATVRPEGFTGTTNADLDVFRRKTQGGLQQQKRNDRIVGRAKVNGLTPKNNAVVRRAYQESGLPFSGSTKAAATSAAPLPPNPVTGDQYSYGGPESVFTNEVPQARITTQRGQSKGPIPQYNVPRQDGVLPMMWNGMFGPVPQATGRSRRAPANMPQYK